MDQQSGPPDEGGGKKGAGDGSLGSGGDKGEKSTTPEGAEIASRTAGAVEQKSDFENDTTTPLALDQKVSSEGDACALGKGVLGKPSTDDSQKTSKVQEDGRASKKAPGTTESVREINGKISAAAAAKTARKRADLLAEAEAPKLTAEEQKAQETYRPRFNKRKRRDGSATKSSALGVIVETDHDDGEDEMDIDDGATDSDDAESPLRKADDAMDADDAEPPLRKADDAMDADDADVAESPLRKAGDAKDADGAMNTEDYSNYVLTKSFFGLFEDKITQACMTTIECHTQEWHETGRNLEEGSSVALLVNVQGDQSKNSIKNYFGERYPDTTFAFEPASKYIANVSEYAHVPALYKRESTTLVVRAPPAIAAELNNRTENLHGDKRPWTVAKKRRNKHHKKRRDDNPVNIPTISFVRVASSPAAGITIRLAKPDVTTDEVITKIAASIAGGAPETAVQRGLEILAENNALITRRGSNRIDIQAANTLPAMHNTVLYDVCSTGTLERETFDEIIHMADKSDGSKRVMLTARVTAEDYGSIVKILTDADPSATIYAAQSSEAARVSENKVGSCYNTKGKTAPRAILIRGYAKISRVAELLNKTVWTIDVTKRSLTMTKITLAHGLALLDGATAKYHAKRACGAYHVHKHLRIFKRWSSSKAGVYAKDVSYFGPKQERVTYGVDKAQKLHSKTRPTSGATKAKPNRSATSPQAPKRRGRGTKGAKTPTQPRSKAPPGSDKRKSCWAKPPARTTASASTNGWDNTHEAVNASEESAKNEALYRQVQGLVDQLKVMAAQQASLRQALDEKTRSSERVAQEQHEQLSAEFASKIAANNARRITDMRDMREAIEHDAKRRSEARGAEEADKRAAAEAEAEMRRAEAVARESARDAEKQARRAADKAEAEEQRKKQFECTEQLTEMIKAVMQGMAEIKSNATRYERSLGEESDCSEGSFDSSYSDGRGAPAYLRQSIVGKRGASTIADGGNAKRPRSPQNVDAPVVITGNLEEADASTGIGFEPLGAEQATKLQ